MPICRAALRSDASVQPFSVIYALLRRARRCVLATASHAASRLREAIKLLLLVISQLHEGVASRVYRWRHRLLAAEASVFATEPRTLSTPEIIWHLAKRVFTAVDSRR